MHCGGRQIHYSHHGGNAHRTSQNGAVRIARPHHRDQSYQLLDRHLAQHRRGQLLCNQNHPIGILDRQIADTLLQAGQYPTTQIFNIGATLSQIGVFHQFKFTHMTLHNPPQRTLRPLSLANLLFDLTRQRIVIEHPQIDIKQGLLFAFETASKATPHDLDVVPDSTQGRMKTFELPIDIIGALIGDPV